MIMRVHVFLIEGDPSNTKEATQTKKITSKLQR